MPLTIKFLFLTLALTILMPSVADAQKRLVPCGYYLPAPEQCADPDVPETCTPGPGQQYVQCNVCHIFTLTTNILDFLWYRITLPVTALMFVIGGFCMIVGPWMGKVNLHSYGLKVLKYTAMGLIIMFCAWIFTDTVIKVFGGKFTAASPTGKFLPWNKIECIVPDKIITVPPPPVSDTLCKGGQEVVDGINVCAPGTKEFFDDNIKNPEGNALKIEPMGGCSKLDQWSSQISTAAQKYKIDESYLKAIIMIESSGNPQATHKDRDGKSSYGFGQFRFDTFTDLMPSFNGKSESEMIAYLFDPDHNIDLTAQNLKKNLDKYGSLDFASAAHNGGPGANDDSKNCPGIKKWQCPWDSSGCWGTSRTACKPNERSGHLGYGGTRRYIPKASSMRQSIMSGTCK